MDTYRAHWQRQRGMSLVEALVAFGVMSFGMLAVVGMQTTLRANGDLSRQRTEAVRIAQDAIEEWRGLTAIAATVNRMSYADISSAASEVVGTNATYQLRRQVNQVPEVANAVTPQRRTLVVDVSWQDRSGQTQNVRLPSMIVGLEPTVSASLVLGANPDPVITPFARRRGIPTSAVAMPDGRSSGFVPPGQAGAIKVAWLFNNLTGVITVCTTTGDNSAALLVEGTTPLCGVDSVRALLVAGAVRYTPNDPGISASVANPSGLGFPLFGLSLRQTLPDASLRDNVCYPQQPVVDSQVLYYCAVPITPEVPSWNGRLVFGAPLVIAAVNGTSAAEYKVCRYHSADSYTNVATPTISQNFVIVKAGDGASPYQCPVVGTPRTWAHQPA